MIRPIKKCMSMALSLLMAAYCLPGMALAEEKQQFPLGYDFYEDLQDWEEGLSSANSQKLSIVTEGKESFARLQALAGSTFLKRTNCTYTPDVKLNLSEPYVLGKNTTTLISAKFRTNHTEYFHKVLALNYSDTDTNERYSKHWDTLIMETNGKFREFTDWGTNAPKSTTVLENIAENKWYTQNCYIETDSTGAIYAVSFEIIDSDSGESLKKTEKRVLNSEHTLKNITQIESLGFEMRILTKDVTVPQDGINIDFDDVLIATYKEEMSANLISKNNLNNFYEGDRILIKFDTIADEATVNEESIKVFKGEENITYSGEFRNGAYIITPEEEFTSGKYTIEFDDNAIKGKNENGESAVPFVTQTLEFNYIAGALPEVKDISLAGEYLEGEILKVGGEYYQEDGVLGYLEYKWYYEDNNKRVCIENENSNELEVDGEIFGKNICCGITPVRNDGIKGNEVFSTYAKPAMPPAANNVRIEGECYVGEIITGAYDFYDENGDKPGKHKFAWYTSDSFDEEFIPVSGNKSEVYVITDDDFGKYIRFEVTPISEKAPYMGDTKYAIVGPVKKVSATGDNLVPNGGFETGNTTGWYVRKFGADTDAGITAVDTAPYSGNYCGFVQGKTEASTFAHWNSVELKANKIYIGSAMVKLSETAPGDTISFNMYTFPDPIPSGTHSIDKPAKSVGKNEWTQITGLITTGNSNVTTGFIPTCWPNGNKGYDYYIDEVYFSELKINDVVVKLPENISIPTKGIVSENIEIKAVMNQIGTAEGLDGASTHWELMQNYNGVSIEDNKIIVTDKAVSGTIYLKAVCSAKGVEEYVKYYPIELLSNNSKQPKVENALLKGITEQGEKLSLTYDFYQIDGGDDDSLIEWFVSDTQKGEYTQIKNGVKEIIVDVNLVGKYIKVKITPVSGELSSNAVYSNEVGPKTKPTANNVYIDGKMIVGKELVGKYTFYDFNGDEEKGTVFKWQRADSEKGSFTDIDGAVSKNYKLTDSDVGMWIRFVCIPAAEQETGEPVYSKAEKGPVLPEIKQLSIVKNSGRLSAKYDYFHEYGSVEAKSEIEWYVDGSKASSDSSITLSSGTYSVVLKVTPVATDAPYRGKTVSVSATITVKSSYSGGGGFSGGSGGGSFGGTASLPNNSVDNITSSDKIIMTDMQSHWAKDYAQTMIDEGIMTLDEQSNFNPETLVTRAELIRYMFVAFKFEKTAYSGIFEDVSQNDDFADMLETFVNEGIISRDVKFRPNDNISRQEAAKVFVLVMKCKGELTEINEVKTFTDAHLIGGWAMPYVEDACRAGLIVGNEDGSFNPKGNITKAQTAAIIKRSKGE